MDNYGMYGNTAMGVYSPQNQFDLDPIKLQSLGFTQEEIQTLQNIVYCGGKTSIQALTQYGLSYEQAKRLRYMYDVCIGKVMIESTDDLCKHLKKMFGGSRKIGIQDLAVSKVKAVPRKAVVAGISDRTFGIYNSSQYPVMERMYDVVDVTTTRIHVETDRKPVLKYKQDKFIDGVVEIKEVKQNGKLTVAFDKKYCKLLNRFIVVASLRRPEYHLGLLEIICIEGTKVYVYAQTIGVKDTVSYNMSTQRVYAYGFYPNEIQGKLKAVGAGLYKQLCGVYANSIPANQDFRMLTIEEEKDEDDIELED